jgi:hypothetical protein
MAHIGEKLAFGFGRRLSGDLRFLQLLLRLLTLGDVFDNAFVVQERTVRVLDRTGGFRDPNDLSVSTIDLRLESRHRTIFV